METHNGFYCGIEGLDGAGKDTLRERLEEKYAEKGVIFTREPGGTPYAEEYRKLLLDSLNAPQSDDLTRILGFFAARADHVKNLIIPMLKQGRGVISVRNDMSSYIYNTRKKEDKKLFWILRQAVFKGYEPNLYILIDVSPETSMVRKKNGGLDKNHYDKAKLDELIRRREAAHEFLKNVPHEIIDAEQSKEMVYKNAVKILDRYL